MKVGLVVFDMVGTTVEAGDEVPRSFREALGSVGIVLSDAAISKIRGRSKRNAISDLLAEHAVDPVGKIDQVELVYARFQSALRDAYHSTARAVPGAEDVFRYLGRAGVGVVLTTGLDGGTAQLLFEGLGWGSLGLLGLVTGDDVSRGRPAPDLIFSAMNLAGVGEAQSVVSVGDTTSDLDAAAAAGVGYSVGVLSGAHSRSQLENHPHSVILESVQTLPTWLEGVGVL